MYRLLCHCCRYGNDKCYKLILLKCNIIVDKMKQLLHINYPRTEDEDENKNELNNNNNISKLKQTYYDKTLLSWAILGGKSDRVYSILPFCDKLNLMQYLLKTDIQGRRPFIYIVKKKKYKLALDILKYIDDMENQLKLISIATAELKDNTLQSKFEEIIIQNQKDMIHQKSSN